MNTQLHTVTSHTGRRDCASHALKVQFLETLTKYFCIYTSNIEQLYTSYKIDLPNGTQHKLTISVNDDSPFDYFVDINASAICCSKLFFIPGKLVGKQGIQVAALKNSNTLSAQTQPMATIVNQVLQKTTPDSPFLPIIVSQDVKKLASKTVIPAMGLYYIKLSKLSPSISYFDKQDLINTVSEKLASLYKVEDVA